ncbi:Major facilitator superfamily MFS_1 [Pseudodesulfovibrio profundus]|uniref:Major facilitator superfamily MFS_1 n=1 Tax=Pseudodesulfovibrio profundus TaxID=57320 RepID=A0A2C8F7K8_9BACT|nr:MFS transporter [Pseudodesulfovibrio profundus]SOB58370.1 Major facilitator superfamily MFS_1 [Pseudodesulfovibrio profundus]
MSSSSSTQHALPFRSALPAVLFVTSIFFCNFLSRVMFAPLMPVIQDEMGFTHAGAGQLFLALGIGNGVGLLLSGFISREVDHRRTVAISSILVGICVLIVTQTTGYGSLMGAMLALGMAVGLYLPSGMATLTSLVRNKDWGKSIAVHELAPNVAYVAAPLLAESLLLIAGWKGAFYLLGGAQIVLGLLFLRRGRGGEFPGMVPGPLMVAQILRRPIFWLLMTFFAMAVGASIGPYSMLPLYLVDAHGFTREEANKLLAASRIMACFMPFLAGWITDKWGAKPAILLYLVTNGVSLILLGVAKGSLLVSLVVMQPVFSVLLFAPGFTVLASAFPPEHRSVAIALMGPLNATIGMGLVPTFLGYMGDAGMFGAGFMVQGAILLITILFLPILPKGRAN